MRPAKPLVKRLAGVIGCLTVVYIVGTLYSGGLRLPSAGGPLRLSVPTFDARSADYGAVEHFSVPMDFNKSAPSVGREPTSGALHIFLKAVKWNDGHVRMKGFVFFEFTAWPTHWLPTPVLRYVPARNIPEVYQRLRLGVRSPTQGWEKEITLETAFCTYFRQGATNDAFHACVEAAKKTDDAYYDYPDISVDFGIIESFDFDLFIFDWPRYISLASLLKNAAEQPDTSLDLQPKVYKVIPPLHPQGELTVNHAAQLLVWQVEHHVAIGFTSIIMYAYPHHALLLEAIPAIQELISQRQLIIVNWNSFFLFRDFGFFDQQVVNAHGVLSFWGGNAHVFPADLDEFLIPVATGDNVPTMLSTGCLSAHPECITLPAQAIFPHQQDPPNVNEPDLWKRPGVNPLHNYRYRTPHGGMEKSLVDPNRVFPMAVHTTSVCSGTSQVLEKSSPKKPTSPCTSRKPCAAGNEACAWVAHVNNMHRVRVTPLNATLMYPDWLWMQKQH